MSMKNTIPNKVTDAPALPQNVRERQAQHRKHLMLAMQALPSGEVLDIVAAAITSRADYDAADVKKFSAEMSNWSWPYVVA